MSNEQKALQTFYKSIGRELDEKVVAKKDGVTLQGNFSMTQLRLIMEAYQRYQAETNSVQDEWQLFG